MIGVDLTGISNMALPSDPADDAKAEAGDADNCVDGNPEPEDEEERCRRVISQCKDKCSQLFDEDGELLPGNGKDFFFRMRNCIRSCSEQLGCFNY